MDPIYDYTRGYMVRVLSTLLERRVVEFAAREANLEYIDKVLRQKRGSKRLNTEHVLRW